VLQEEAGRLQLERAQLIAASSPGLGLLFPLFGLVALVGDAAGVDDRASSVDALLQEIDDFVGGVFVRVERRAAEGDAAAAARLLRATRSIVDMVAGTSIVDDTIDDITAAVKESKDDLLELLERIMRAVAGVAGAVVVGGIGWHAPVLFGAPLWVRLASALAGGVGGGVGGVTLGQQAARALLQR
jgi:hypothetical protein